ncbi:MAG: hypothetical protein ACI8XO_000635 [Verrucomicrobiales bacterium]|jgi:hypothetical protein
MKITQLLFASILAAFACSCSSIDKPKGNSKGFQSARFVKTTSTTTPQGLEDTPAVNKIVQDAITSEFSKRGMTVGDAGADVIIAYMLIRQDTSATTMNPDHFGYGRDAEAILERAHERGTIENKSPDAFEAGAIVIDILDARSNELVFRNFAKRSVIEGISEEAREQRIASAVAEAMAPFFK